MVQEAATEEKADLTAKGFDIASPIGKRIFSLLGLGVKAGQVTFGFEELQKCIRFRKASLVILAADLSDNTSTKCIRTLQQSDVAYYVAGTKEILGTLLHRDSIGIIIVTGRNFADGILKLLHERSGGYVDPRT